MLLKLIILTILIVTTVLLTSDKKNGKDKNFETEYVKMRDGVNLAIDYYLPGKDKYPVIVEITPYGRGLDGLNFRNEAEYWSKNGYVFLIADCRGTGDSSGEFEFFVREGDDGYDLIEWIGRQPWSNGRVAMRGSSYSGTNQWFVAVRKPNNLKCITPSATLGRTLQHPPYLDGAFGLQWSLDWIGRSVNTKDKVTKWINGSDKWLDHKPLYTMDVFAGGKIIPLYRKYLDHPTRDSYWNKIELNEADYSRINIPSLAFTGWFDGTMYGTIMRFEYARKYSQRKNDQFIFIGPYNHLNAPDGGYDFQTGKPYKTIGVFNVSENALLPALNMTKNFFDWCLKNGSKPDWNQSNIYITGSNKWIKGNKFSPENQEEKILYLSSLGNSNTFNGDGQLVTNSSNNETFSFYNYDPKNPVSSEIFKELDAPIDFNFYLNRSDFLVYTTKTLKKPLTVIGDVFIELTISTNTKDTDFVVFLMDVFEDGRSIRLGSMAGAFLRARYRNGYEQEVLMEPSKKYNLTLNFHEIGHTFLVGHKIRLAITSSFFPHISANPNTGNSIANDTDKPIISEQKIYHGDPKINGIVSRIRFFSNDNIYESF